MDQLKHHYKTLARQLHPDKLGSKISQDQANATFQTLTDAYHTLLEVLANQVQSRPFHDLRAGSQTYIQQQQQHNRSQVPSQFFSSGDGGTSSSSAAAYQQRSSVPERQRPHPTHPMQHPQKSPFPPSLETRAPPPPMTSKKFDLQMFNEVYEKNRIEDPIVDQGYSNWMATSDPGRDENMQRMQLCKYRPPDAFFMTSTGKGTTAFTELGLTQVDDYGRYDGAGGKKSVQYSDYRIAHTTCKLGDEAMVNERDMYKNVDELKVARSQISFQMSPEEHALENERRIAEKAEEDRRREACALRDRMYAERHGRIHQKMLGYAAPSY